MTITNLQALGRLAAVAAVALACGAAAPARAAGTTPAGGTTTDPTVADVPVTQDAMARYDLDKDGKLSVTERAAYRRDVQQKAAPMRKAMMAKYDWDRNGRIEGTEREAMRAARTEQNARAEARALERYDANGNGTLEPAEQEARRAAREAWLQNKRNQALQTFDANRNGVLDASEKATIRQQVEAGRTRALEMYDANRDGRIDAAERSVIDGVSRDRLSPDGARSTASRTVRISAASGGTAQTWDGGAKLVIPAGALTQTANVAVTATSVEGETVEHGRRVLGTYTVSVSGGTLKNPATLDVTYAAVAKSVTGPNLVIAHWSGERWVDVGGTLAEGTQRLSAAVTASGRYGLLERVSAPPGAATIGALKMTPADGQRFGSGVDIAFALGSAGGVTIKVFDTSGRLVRTVAARQSLAGGEHVIRWDGRGTDGRIVANGLYLVTVEGPVNRLTRKVSFLR